MVEKELEQVIEALEELKEDTTIPRNIRLRIEEIIQYLKDGSDISIKINKAFNELDEIANESNIPSYTRTQIWSIVSLLERV